jgi:ankyrin repeat protein
MGKIETLRAAGDGEVIEYDSRARTRLDLTARQGEVGMVWPKGSSLLWAAEYGNIDMMKFLLMAGVNPKVTRPGKVTALHLAARKGCPAIIKMLLEKGVDVNSADVDGVTPLHEAARNGHLEAVEMLIFEKADYKALDSDGNSVLHEAASRTLDFPRPHEELCKRKLEIIKILLNYGVPVTGQSKSGYTALYYGARLGSVEIVKYLMEQGDFMGLTDQIGRNALLSAIHNEWSNDVIIALLDGGFPIESQTHYGHTAVHLAILNYKWAEEYNERNRAKATIELLINRGANLITADKGGVSALEEIEETERWPFIILFCIRVKTAAEKFMLYDVKRERNIALVAGVLVNCPYEGVELDHNNNYTREEINEYLKWACRCRGLIERVKGLEGQEIKVKARILYDLMGLMWVCRQQLPIADDYCQGRKYQSTVT